jgi:hypothetical protein
LDGIVLPEQFLREDDELYFGLPDTIWYPKDAFSQLDTLPGELVLGLFDTGTPEKFDSVVVDKQNRITSIEVKVAKPKTKWTWAIGKMTVKAARLMRKLEYRSDGKPNSFGGVPNLFGNVMEEYCLIEPGFAVQLKNSHCIDIGVPDDYDRADAFVKQYEK